MHIESQLLFGEEMAYRIVEVPVGRLRKSIDEVSQQLVGRPSDGVHAMLVVSVSLYYIPFQSLGAIISVLTTLRA